ncbi:MAG: LPXTG cell wall anchor domain-containing protein, partial [Ruminococcus sp.]|nr:LPXTG cell wall anchor domain-containing protein [Ruminococcus sp.]
TTTSTESTTTTTESTTTTTTKSTTTTTTKKKPAAVTTGKTQNPPKTGDNGIMFAITITALAATAAYVTRSRKKEDEE